MRIEILYFDGCPNYKPTVDRVREVLVQENQSVEIQHVEVEDLAHAEALGFVGSPSVRVNGVDVHGRSGDTVSLCCRTYADGEGIPSVEDIREAIRLAAQD
jgi:hypothetical protein